MIVTVLASGGLAINGLLVGNTGFDLQRVSEPIVECESNAGIQVPGLVLMWFGSCRFGWLGCGYATGELKS